MTASENNPGKAPGSARPSSMRERLGLYFLICCAAFARGVSVAQARRVLRASLIYLPALLAFLLFDELSASVALAFGF